MTRIRTFAAVLCLCMTAWPAVRAQTQTPAKPQGTQARPPSIVVPATPTSKAASKPAASKTLSGKAGSGKVLTLEELRACMKRQEGVGLSNKDLAQRRAALDREKEGLVKSGEALQAARADVEAKLAAVREWEGRMRAHGAEIETFNKRLKAAEELSANQRERQAKEFDAERERLNKARQPLTEDEARLVPAYQNAVKSYNEQAAAREVLVTEWNGRNQALNDANQKNEEERSIWVNECASRPYREDDEIAIKAGK
jgi:chromosome segregation ATPase